MLWNILRNMLRISRFCFGSVIAALCIACLFGSGFAATGDSDSVSLVGRWGAGPCRAVDAMGDAAFFGNGAYLEIVAFVDPESPMALGRCLLPGPIHDVVFASMRAYVAVGGDGLRIVDLLDMSAPVEIGVYDALGFARGVAVQNGLAYLAVGGAGLQIIDVSDPADPVEVGYFDT